MKILRIVIMYTIAFNCAVVCQGSTIVVKTYNDLASAIYWAEGGPRAKKPFGILSVSCDGYEECRKICIDTIRNNVKRWEISGKEEPYLNFLARRYAPIGANNDPSNLNVNWKKNVIFFLNHPKGEK